MSRWLHLHPWHPIHHIGALGRRDVADREAGPAQGTPGALGHGARTVEELMIDLARQLAAAIETEHPVVHCWACLARRLGTEEGKIRDAAQQLLMMEPGHFVLARRSCAGCEGIDELLVLV